MSITAEDFLKLTPEQMKHPSGACLHACGRCGRCLCTSSAMNKIGETEVCEDCYFTELGVLLAEHPIGLPMGQRG